jgi:protease PrsW
VVLFLIALQVMDSFKLVRPRTVLTAIGAGAVAALLSLALYDPVREATGAGAAVFTRYVAPVIEELAKASFVIYSVTRSRLGFLVDAAVIGFAVGAGFGLIENVHYLALAPPQTPTMLWLVRGLGTAMLHGATMSVFAMMSKTMADRATGRLAPAFLPGLAVAIVIHSAFNHILLPPLIGSGLDLEMELLQLVTSEHFVSTRFGRYLQQLRARFPGPIVTDMFCLLRVELELSVQARAMLMAREAGLDVPFDEDVPACLAELEYLHRSIGPTGMLALKPLQVTGQRDQWHKYLMREAASRRLNARP